MSSIFYRDHSFLMGSSPDWICINLMRELRSKGSPLESFCLAVLKCYEVSIDYTYYFLSLGNLPKGKIRL
jgi:hypothetical protein